MVLAFGLDHIIISADRPKDPKASRYLENTATTRGKPSFTAEAGRSGPVENRRRRKTLRRRAERDGASENGGTVAAPVRNPVWVEKIVSLTAERDGMFHPIVDRDAHVAKGAKVGIVTDYLNRPLQDVRRAEAGIIMFIRALPSLKKGDTLASIGVVKMGG